MAGFFQNDEKELDYYSIIISYVYKRLINTSDIFLGTCIPLYWPLIDSSHRLRSNQKTFFMAKAWRRRRHHSLNAYILNWWFMLVYVCKRIMDTTSIIVGPSILLLWIATCFHLLRDTEPEPFDLYVWVSTTTLLCALFSCQCLSKPSHV